MESVEFIYSLSDPHKPEEIRYVGWTNDLERRFKMHVFYAKTKTNRRSRTHNARWMRSLLKDGVLPVMRILEENPPEGWAEAEQAWIMTFRLLGYPLTNHTKGGEGTPGYKHTDEARAKMSARLVGKKRSRESIEKANTTRRARGLSDREQANIKRLTKMGADARRGKPLSAEHKAKISAGTRGKLDSAETRAKKSAALKGKAPPKNTSVAGGKALKPKVPCPECGLEMVSSGLPGHLKKHVRVFDQCSVVGCTRDEYGSHRLCLTHYRRKLQYGDPNLRGTRSGVIWDPHIIERS